MNTTTSTYNISLTNHKLGVSRELSFSTLPQAAKRLEEMHQWARDNSYTPGRDYTLTLTAV